MDVVVEPLLAPQQARVRLALDHLFVGISDFGEAMHVGVELICSLLRLGHQLVTRCRD